jgi:putative ABC transport system ATP-binding protein
MSDAPKQFAARCYDLVKEFGHGDNTVTALAGVTLGFGRSEFTAVMGPSGSGKSTLLQTMAGLDHITRGRIFIGDDEIQHLDPTELTKLRRARMGFVFQSFNLVPSLTALQNILLPFKLAKRPYDTNELAALTDRLGITDRLQHRPRQLSGGQQQRVAVARALLGSPELLFADEPTGNLDSRSSAALLQLLREATDQRGQTVVMVTHDPLAAALADRVVFLRDGQVVTDLERPDRDQITRVLAEAV